LYDNHSLKYIDGRNKWRRAVQQNEIKYKIRERWSARERRLIALVKGRVSPRPILDYVVATWRQQWE
jgi:hypothetical protein